MDEIIEEPISQEAGDDNTAENEVEIENESNLTVEDYKKLEAKNKALFERAKKAEEEAKKLKTLTKNNEGSVGLNEETILTKAALIAQGTPRELIAEADFIAKSKGISFKEALEYPTVKAYSAQLEAENRSKKAQLGASNGSGRNNPTDLSQVVGMTREEHMKALGY